MFYTRLGIGVFDPLWWEFRLRLFAAVTLPSIARFCQQGATWALLIDEDMPPAALSRVTAHLQAARIADQVGLIPAQFHFDAPAALARFVGERFGSGHVGLIRIDDDDALSAGFLDRAYAHVPDVHAAEPTIVTLTRGWEVSAADRKMRPLQLEFGSINTLFWGPARLAETYASTGHHRIREWAQARNGHIVSDPSGPWAYLYLRHKQSDSSYPARRRVIVEDPRSRFMTQAVYEDAGIDVASFLEWRAYAQDAPVLPDKTWERASSLLGEVVRLRGEVGRKKQELIAAMSRFVPRDE